MLDLLFKVQLQQSFNIKLQVKQSHSKETILKHVPASSFLPAWILQN